MTLQSVLRRFRTSVSPEDITLLAAHAIRRDRVFVYAHPEHTLSPIEKNRLIRLLERRKRKEPIAYLLGKKEFFGHSFLVHRSVLIPRPETETLVEHTLEKIKNQTKKQYSILDIGTGSGNIILSIASEWEKSHSIFDIQHSTFDFLATDISSSALAVARKNAKRLLKKNPVVFRNSDLLNNVPKKYFKNKHWIITANLPYLSGTLYRNTEKDVRAYEPKSALFAKNRGAAVILSLLREIREKVAEFHPESFFLILEISPEQSSFLLKEAGNILQSNKTILPDLSGKNRFIVITSSV